MSTLPNDVISNLFCAVTIIVVTFTALRIKMCLCDSFRRGPLQLSTDTFILTSNNLVAFSLLVIWSYLLGGNEAAHLERSLVVDVLVVVHIQRFAMQSILKLSYARYHEPGELALRHRKRRFKLYLVMTALSASACAACSAVSERFVMVSHDDDAPPQKYSSRYWFYVALLPMLHASIRTITLDGKMCRNASHGQDTATFPVDVIEETTNSFTITDEEEEYETQLPKDENDELDLPASMHAAAAST